MVAAVPDADGLASRIVQHPAITGIHASLVDAVAEHVVVVAHDNATQQVVVLYDGIAHVALVAFDVQGDARRKLNRRSIRLEPVMRQCQEGAAQAVKGGSRRCTSMWQRANGRFLFRRQIWRIRWWSERIDASLLKPCLPVIGLWRNLLEVLCNVSGNVSVRPRVELDCIVDIPGRLLPWIEHHLFPRVVGVQGGDHALDGVIEEHRADANADVKLEAMGIGEERLVLANGLALVVEDGPAAAHPAWT